MWAVLLGIVLALVAAVNNGEAAVLAHGADALRVLASHHAAVTHVTTLTP